MSVVDHTPSMVIGGKDYRPRRETRTHTSPGSGRPTTAILLGTAEDVGLAVDSARSALPELAAMGLDERARRCEQSAQALVAVAEELAPVITKEQGKPLRAEAIGEAQGAADAFRDAAAQARWLEVAQYPLSTSGKRLISVRRPRGVYGILTPWNYPVATAPFYYLGPGLAAGNAFVWVGAPTTSACHYEVAKALAPLWPPGAINLVTGDGPVVGQALAGHPGVDAVGFTGSTPVGLEVARTAAGKPCMLELGGNGPTLVLEDADVELAAVRIADGTFENAGQICTATGRVLAHRNIASDLADALAQEARRFNVGDPELESTRMGPVHLASIADRILTQVAAAVADGARVVTGGSRLSDAPTSHYVLPTVVDEVPGDSALHRDESFGPIAPVVHFADDSEMWKLVQASPYGLNGAVFSRDVERALGVAERLRCGHVNINDMTAYWEPAIAAGGASGSASGVGRVGGPWSVAEMTEVQTVSVEVRSVGR